MEPDPSVHSPPTHRLQHWRHQQRNFINAYFQIHNNRSSNSVINKTARHYRLTRERVISVESYGFVSYARQALGTRPCRRQYDILRNSLRMQASLFMTLWKVLSVPRDSTTSAFNSLRMQTSQFLTFLKECPCHLTARHRRSSLCGRKRHAHDVVDSAVERDLQP